MAGIITGSINLTAIPKDKIIDGKKGKYLPISITINDEPDQYKNHGPIIVAQSKEERANKENRTFLGNVNVVWTDGKFPSPPPRENNSGSQSNNKTIIDDMTSNDLPF
jgi:hypothetical protein